MRLQTIVISVAIIVVVIWISLYIRKKRTEDEDLYDIKSYKTEPKIFNPSQTEMKKKVIIYILCHNDERYDFVKKYFRNLEWARPVKMKYQDITWENAFWKQLLEMEDEWKDAYMVGTMSAICYKKLNVMNVNDIIVNEQYNYPYHHFMDTNIPLKQSSAGSHPHFFEIWDYMLEELGLPTVTENCCNYWMCSPNYMKKFLIWYQLKCLPTIMKHPLSLSDANYKHMSIDSLIKKWGRPYYPHVPFILERLHKSYFVKLRNEEEKRVI